MTLGYTVYCHICDLGWDEQDPGVRWLYVDHVWACSDEAACFARRAELAKVVSGDGGE